MLGSLSTAGPVMVANWRMTRSENSGCRPRSDMSWMAMRIEVAAVVGSVRAVGVHGATVPLHGPTVLQ